jgi:hypothetical protein
MIFCMVIWRTVSSRLTPTIRLLVIMYVCWSVPCTGFNKIHVLGTNTSLCIFDFHVSLPPSLTCLSLFTKMETVSPTFG